MSTETNNIAALLKIKERILNEKAIMKITPKESYDIISDFNLIGLKNKFFTNYKMIANKKFVSTPITSNGKMEFHIDLDSSEKMGPIWLKFTVKDATNTVTKPLVGFRMIKKIRYINDNAREIIYSGEALYKHIQTHTQDLTNLQLISTLAGGDSLTITSSTNIYVPLYLPSFTSFDFNESGNVFFADPNNGNLQRIELEINDFANIFTVATNATMTEFDAKLMVFCNILEKPQSLTNTIFHKYFTETEFSGTYSTSWNRFNLTSLNFEAILGELHIIPRITADLAAGTLDTFKTSTSIIQELIFMVGSDEIYHYENPGDHNINEILNYGRILNQGTTALANDKFGISIPFSNQNLKFNGKYLHNLGIPLSAFSNIVVMIKFADSQARTIKFVGVYDSISRKDKNNKYNVEFVKAA